LERIERVVEGVELTANIDRHDAGGAEALVGRLGANIDPVDARGMAGLGPELFHRLEEVHVQTGEAIETGELGIRGSAGGS
jgi:hypothetical protein